MVPMWAQSPRTFVVLLALAIAVSPVATGQQATPTSTAILFVDGAEEGTFEVECFLSVRARHTGAALPA